MSGRNTKAARSKKQLRFVVDANILLASLLRASSTRELLLDDHLTLFAPEHLLIKTERHLLKSDRIRRRIVLSELQLQTLLTRLTANIIVVAENDYEATIQTALAIAPHPEDAPYLALALHLKVPLWSNDRGMAEQQKVQVITTKNMVTKLEMFD